VAAAPAAAPPSYRPHASRSQAHTTRRTRACARGIRVILRPRFRPQLFVREKRPESMLRVLRSKLRASPSKEPVATRRLAARGAGECPPFPTAAPRPLRGERDDVGVQATTRTHSINRHASRSFVETPRRVVRSQIQARTLLTNERLGSCMVRSLRSSGASISSHASRGRKPATAPLTDYVIAAAIVIAARLPRAAGARATASAYGAAGRLSPTRSQRSVGARRAR
jgi:hypothetical protein